MQDAGSTRWSVVLGAAEGNPEAREAFAREYLPAVRAYLASRWRSSPLLADLDDAAQEVFVEFFREAGALDRLDPDRPGGFRAFLCGVVRNVARRAEVRWTRRRARDGAAEVDPEAVAGDDLAQSRAFDRAWATAVMRQAGALQVARAREAGPAALRRVELLRERVVEGKPIRDIAAERGEDPARVHHEYARARREFREALEEVVAGLHPGSPPSVEAECRHLLDLFA